MVSAEYLGPDDPDQRKRVRRWVQGSQPWSGAPVQAAVVTADCLGCGACLEQCPVQAVEFRDGRYVVGPGCNGCLACLEVCPADAIEPQTI